MTGDISIKVKEITHPCQPCTTLRSKSQVPSWLKGLEELIWLEKGGYPPSIDETNDNNVTQEKRAVSLVPGLI